MNLKTLSLLIVVSLYSCASLGQSPENAEGKSLKVLCSNKIDQREIAYDDVKDAWCDTTLVNFCALNKRRAIASVCSDIYKNRLVRRERNKSQAEPIEAAAASTQAQEDNVLISSLEQEKLDIETKRLEIDQRRLELRRKELDLIRQQQEYR